jgi:hypothetical protein
MRLPVAPTLYDAQNEQATRQIQELADTLNLKRNQDIELGKDCKITVGPDRQVVFQIDGLLVLTSPDGTQYSLTVDNSGTLTTTAL